MIRYSKEIFVVILLSICIALVHAKKKPKSTPTPVSFKKYSIERINNGIGKPKSYTFANGAIISFRYDKSGRLIKLTWPDQSFVIYKYNRNLLTMKLEAGRTTSYKYDDFGRMIKKIISQGKIVFTETRTYNSKGNLTSVSEDGKSITTFLYDRFGRKLIEAGSGGTLKYLYDSFGRLITREAQIKGSPKKNQTYFGYDKWNRITRVYSSSGRFLLTWSKKVKQLSRIELFLNISLMRKKQASYVIQNKFDKKGRHVSKYLTLNNNSPEKYSSLKYNKLNQVAQSTCFDVEWNYQYNEFNQLISANNNKETEYKYSYDNVGNCVPDGNVKLSYNNMWQINSPEYQYDTFGNLIASPDAQYKYDLKDRLIEKKTSNKIVRYQYDPLDQIVSCEIIDMVNPVNNAKTNYLMSDMIEYARINQSIPVYHTFTPNVINKVNKFKNPVILLASTGMNNKCIYYLTGMSGDIIASFDSTKDKIIEKATYSPFGKISSGNSQNLFPMGYKSMFSPDGSLYYYKDRFYDPELLCYLTPNSSVEKEGNPYLFDKNNPIGKKNSFIDTDRKTDGYLDFPLKPDLKNVFNLKEKL